MYLVTQFAWPVVREFHAASLFEIECGRARWGDSFAHLESRLLRATGKPVSNSSPSRQSSAVLFCRDFQTSKCMHSKDHYGLIRNERKWLLHINSGRMQDPILAACLRELWFLAASYEFELRAVHLSSAANRLADLLSRWHLNPKF